MYLLFACITDVIFRAVFKAMKKETQLAEKES